MNLKELKESLNEVKASKKELLTKAVVEVRSLEASENEELRQLDEKISDLQNQIQSHKYLLYHPLECPCLKACQ